MAIATLALSAATRGRCGLLLAALLFLAAPAVGMTVDGRYLRRDTGETFVWIADTCWECIPEMSTEEQVGYLDDRRAKGFTVVMAVILKQTNGITTRDVNGNLPFTTPRVGTANEAYFRHVDHFVDQAAAKGLTVVLLPTWGNHVNNGWFTVAQARSYGRYVGNRYRNWTHIVWALGGDRDPTSTTLPIWRAMADGLSVDDALMTYHPRTCSYTKLHHEPWLDFNMCQSGHGRLDLANYNVVVQGRARTPIKPVIDAEPRYENHAIGFDAGRGYFNDSDVRQAAYWQILAGSMGHAYGNHAVWFVDRPPTSPIPYHAPKVRGWRAALNMPGADDIKHLRALLDSRPLRELTPDQSLVTSTLSGAAHIRAARGTSWAWIYAPTGASFTVRMGKIGGAQVCAQWFDPRTGTIQDIGARPNADTAVFDPPGSPARGNDWLLMLDAPCRGTSS